MSVEDTPPTLSVGITGGNGRMGSTVRTVALERGLDIAFAVDRAAESGDEAVVPATRYATLIDETDPDVVVDFTGPESTVEYVSDAADAGVPFVTGTTGFDEEQRALLEEAGAEIPVIRGANFARGVQALLDAVAAAIDSVPEYDVELTETHHNGKRDAPSGTAGVILDEIEARRDDTGDRIHGRVGEAQRETGEIGVHARRAGDVTGEHEVFLAGNRETLSLTHRAGSRSVFAEGALDAACWLVDQPAGFYQFADIAAELSEVPDR